MQRRWRILFFLRVLCLTAFVGGWMVYGCVTWLSFGVRSQTVEGDTLLDRHMPRVDIVEVDHTRVAASASRTFNAAAQVDLQRSAVIHAIFRAREVMLRSSAQTRPANESFFDELEALGWGVLEVVPHREIVFGAVTQPWKADVVFRALPPRDFAAFDSAGCVKIVVSFAADSVGPSASEFRTETRAFATDPASRAKCRRYWAVFSPGILLIRTGALKLVRRDAEAP